VLVLSDSQQSVARLRPAPGSGDGLGRSAGAYWSLEDRVHASLDRLKAVCPALVELDWIPAHCDVAENDAADALAKAGAVSSRSLAGNAPGLSVLVPYSVSVRWIREGARMLWLSWSDVDCSARGPKMRKWHRTRPFDAIPSWVYGSSRRAVQSMVDRFRTLTCLSYLDRFWAGGDPCQYCGEGWGPVKHVVNDCSCDTIVAARQVALDGLEALGVSSRDHLFNVMFRLVGVPKQHWRAVAQLGAEFLVGSDILGRF